MSMWNELVKDSTVRVNRNLCSLLFKGSDLNTAAHNGFFTPHCVSNCKFSRQLLRVALFDTAIENCGLSLFGLQHTFTTTTTAVRWQERNGKNEWEINRLGNGIVPSHSMCWTHNTLYHHQSWSIRSLKHRHTFNTAEWGNGPFPKTPCESILSTYFTLNCTSAIREIFYPACSIWTHYTS